MFLEDTKFIITLIFFSGYNNIIKYKTKSNGGFIMNENNFNNINNGYPENNHQNFNNDTAQSANVQNVTANTQSVYKDTNSFSQGDSQYASADITSRSDIQQMQYNNYTTPFQTVPQQYSANVETQPTGLPQYYSVAPNEPKKPKKSKKGKKVALVACALALTLCVGVGGGFLGSYLANGNQTSPAVADTSTVKDNSNTSQNSDSGITIVQASNTETTPTTTQEVVQKVQNSVVEITTEITQYDSFYGQYVSSSAGSGVIISPDGYIITNNHVIEDATSVNVRLTDGKTYPAKLIGTDATLDVALIKIEASDLTVATFGDSSKLVVGQTAIAVGNPLGELGGTVTDGIISALDREIQIDGKTMTLLQTNAAINPGNSGGGLFDANGNLIGIVVAKSMTTSSGASLEGLGFAIPVNNIIDILGDLKSSGYVTGRPSLGVELVDINRNSMFMYRVDKEGTYVSRVSDESAAKKAGIESGDCITKFNGIEVSTSAEVKNELSKYKAGDKVTVTVYRNGRTLDLKVTLDENVPENIMG